MTKRAIPAIIDKSALQDVSPFDPTDPFDSQCERLRRSILQLAIDGEKITLYREMDPQRQLEALVCGVLVGLIGATFASIKPTDDARNCMIEYITTCIPVARQMADAIHDGAGYGE